jgi:hypothetical protein
MRKQIVITVERLADGSHMPRLRDFGEDLWRMFRSGDEVLIDLDKVDRADERFSLIIKHNRRFRRILGEIEDLMEEQFPDRIASIAIEDAE